MAQTSEVITSVEWRGERTCEAFADDDKKSRGLIGSAQDAGVREKTWTPPDMVCASLAACIVLTFLHFVRQNSIALIKCQAKVTGTLTKGKNGFSFTKFVMECEATVESGHREKAEEAWELGERFCLVSNSLTGEKELKYTVIEEKSE